MNSINANLAARNTAGILNRHYARLSTSVQRLSSGLRINSAADDAAGLAIRELMRADVAALHQGARNANDAISMLQVADGALAIIDEKLIRMKELAEQAATGTYDSTQRMIIDSEYQEMAREIDRIANATDFNGIKLLDGSLSGKHNGAGLNSTGAIKIHFGTANDSSEDYYYVNIGACTAAALGLGAGSAGAAGKVEYVRVETVGEVPQVYNQKTSYLQYKDPVTGKVYYNDGDKFFSDLANPAGTYLDETVDRVIIERLGVQQDQVADNFYYDVYIDPQTNAKYYGRGRGLFTADAYDPYALLDANDPADKQILDRLQRTTESVTVTIYWGIYEDPAGKKYYSYNDGRTFVPDYKNPNTGVIDSNNPADRQLVDSLKPVMTTKEIKRPVYDVEFEEFFDEVTSTSYWSSDNGKTFLLNYYDAGSVLTDRNVIDRLKFVPQESIMKKGFDIYTDPDTGANYYTDDFGATFITDVTDPENSALDKNDSAQAAIMARLKPNIRKAWGRLRCQVYEDPTNGNKKYYSHDNGRTFFDDLQDYKGSKLNTGDPGYAALVANLKKADTTVDITVTWDMYRDKTGSSQLSYYSMDGGQTFYRTTDPTSSPLHEQSIIKNLVPECDTRDVELKGHMYYDPATKRRYYLPEGGDGSVFYDERFHVMLEKNNPAQLAIIDRLQNVQSYVTISMSSSLPDKYYIYEDVKTGKIYYSPDEGQTFTSDVTNPYSSYNRLDPDDPDDRAILDRLQPKTTIGTTVEYVKKSAGGDAVAGAGQSISTQQAAQEALTAIDRAIVSKDKIRAHLGALQNRLENTVTNLTIQAENLQASESRISDTDVANEMMEFVRNQVLTQSAVAMLGQANSYPHMLMALLQT